MISHEIKKKLTKDNLFGIIITLNLTSNKYIYIMKSSQHWKHRLKKSSVWENKQDSQKSTSMYKLNQPRKFTKLNQQTNDE